MLMTACESISIKSSVAFDFSQNAQSICLNEKTQKSHLKSAEIQQLLQKDFGNQCFWTRILYK